MSGTIAIAERIDSFKGRAWCDHALGISRPCILFFKQGACYHDLENGGFGCDGIMVAILLKFLYSVEEGFCIF